MSVYDINKINFGGNTYKFMDGVALTQAEYDALSTAEKNNGTVYYITDGEAYGFNAEDISATDKDGHESTVQDVLDDIASITVADGAGAHNGIYRGKYLGSSVTSTQYAAVNNGTFKDLYIGDYWTISNINWRIAHFDYWLRCGDTECVTHHIVIVPDTNLYTAQMNTSNVTTGAYIGSKMYTSNLATAKTTINNAFGSAHILNHRQLFANAVSSNASSSWAWYDSTVDLMNEPMVYGTRAWSVSNGYDVGIDKGQLALFAMEPSKICNRANWWLRDVSSSTDFADVAGHGYAYVAGASYSFGVRPAFGLCS